MTDWHGCYDDSWKGEIVEDAFAHPAKMARGLVRRIFDHLDLPKGSVVVEDVTEDVLERIRLDLSNASVYDTGHVLNEGSDVTRGNHDEADSKRPDC